MVCNKLFITNLRTRGRRPKGKPILEFMANERIIKNYPSQAMGIPCTRMEKQEMARHFISNSYKFHPQISILQFMVSNQPNDQTPSFSLLPTVCPIPMHSQFGPIAYKGPVVVDRERQRGYVIGVDDSLCNRQYILAIDYARQPATLTLYHTDT